MSIEDHIFCITLLKIVMKEVKKNTTIETRKNAWAYSFGRTKEFQINKCLQVPNGFYWHGRACCLWEAKAQGWQSFLEKKEKETQ